MHDQHSACSYGPRLPERVRFVVAEGSCGCEPAFRFLDKPLQELPQENLLVKVEYTGINGCDVCLLQNHLRGAAQSWGIPGTDAVGVVVQSGVFEFIEGEQVIVTGFAMGKGTYGGWSQYSYVSHGWAVHLPDELSAAEAIIFGTPGLAAGLAVSAFQDAGILPNDHAVVVTGASGGIGSLAVATLAHLGYRVVAITGKEEAKDWLIQLGAAGVVERSEFLADSRRACGGIRIRGAIDVLGGPFVEALADVLERDGAIALCGWSASSRATVPLPTIISKGCKLISIDAVNCPLQKRKDTWQNLATVWKPPTLDKIAQFVPWEELPRYVMPMLEGKVRGRIVAKVGAD